MNPILVVFPSRGNAFYRNLAGRLATVAGVIGGDPKVVSFDDLRHLDEDDVERTVAFIVRPDECIATSRIGPTLSNVTSRLMRMERVYAVSSEAIGTQWHRRDVATDMRLDVYLDVGFLDQSQHYTADIPYRFVFNAPTDAEAQMLSELVRCNRRIPWACVGHQTSVRLELVSRLLELSPGGFVFLPDLRPVRPGSGLLSPASLRRVLSETDLYVWCSHHAHVFYESFRFIDAVVSGAIPIKIMPNASDELRSIPGVLASVEELFGLLESTELRELYEVARSFYLGTGRLGERLAAAIDV